MTENLQQIRLEKLKKIRSLGINPYPAITKRTHTISQALKSEGGVVAIAGRMMSFREHGNIVFADLVDETGKMQIFFQKKILGDTFKTLKLFDIGDFLQVEGQVGKTVAGEISVISKTFELLSKSILPLPSEWYGLKDTETRYRQRYLDLLLNPDVRKRFNLRTKLVSGIREYLDTRGFWEVETPTLQPLYGGANAKPFRTHLNTLGQDMYLRIADELYLKRLIVGGYERVYEICKDFRNEGIDQTHSPEFTMIEWYEAYADYHIMMDRAEDLIKYLTQKLYKTTTLKVREKAVDIGKKWPRITMVDILKEKLGLDVEKETQENLLFYVNKNILDIQLVGGETKGQLIFAIFDHSIPKLLLEPTWIIDYPQDISPLSKPHRTKIGWVERFEGYVGGKEIFDGWSELTDPQVQRTLLTKDEQAARKDKEEAQHVDEDFLSAIEYGMPPFGGIGVGIDRLAMLFSNTWLIKEVILFPTLKKVFHTGVSQKDESTNKPLKVESRINEQKIPQDFTKKMVIVVNKELPEWQVLNTVGHISAYLGNKLEENFSTGKSFDSKDNIPHPRNTQYPLIILEGKSGQLTILAEKARNLHMLYHGFIREMIETTDDLKIEKSIANKTESEIEYLGVGLWGTREEVDKITKNYSLWK